MEGQKEAMNEWHNCVFNEIICSPCGKQWLLNIPPRCGKTYMCKRLAQYFLAQGRTVYMAGDNYKNIIGAKSWTKMDNEEEPLTPNCVLIVDGLYKWDPSIAILRAGGLVVQTYNDCIHGHKGYMIQRAFHLDEKKLEESP